MKPTNEFKQGDILHIEWMDAFGDSGWTEIQKIPNKAIVRSMGFFLFSDENYITIVQSLPIEEDGQWDDLQDADHIDNYLCIPWGMIMDGGLKKLSTPRT